MLTAQADMGSMRSAASLKELKSQFPKFANTRCVRNGAVYNCNKRLNAAGGNDYWESGVVKPDVVLHDLIAISRTRRHWTKTTGNYTTTNASNNQRSIPSREGRPACSSASHRTFQ